MDGVCICMWFMMSRDIVCKVHSCAWKIIPFIYENNYVFYRIFVCSLFYSVFILQRTRVL